MKYLIILLVFFSACKSPKKIESNLKHKESVQTDNDLHVLNDSYLMAAINNAVSKVVNEELNVNLNKITYDASMPIDPSTGKPPVKEETNVSLSKKTDTMIVDSTTMTKVRSTHSQSIDKVSKNIKSEVDEKTKSETGTNGWVKIVIGIVIGLFSFFIIYVIIKVKA